ncbi:MAG: 30S ribosomal protein S9 [Nanoarchaeota archaeon]|nr:30S ribosomal protein S9 [Nanoarchaeota archaeon]
MTKMIHMSGKRKKAIARATLKEGTGIVRINSKKLEHFNPKIAQLKILEPILLAEDTIKGININIIVKGGGWASQADACRLAIAKGLVEFTKSKKLKQIYLEYDRHLIVADVRVNEPHKPNDSKPRAKRQKSYR